ncbi:hypothetical protein PMIN04_008314 [Paraphaeosphaeria minitans]
MQNPNTCHIHLGRNQDAQSIPLGLELELTVQHLFSQRLALQSASRKFEYVLGEQLCIFPAEEPRVVAVCVGVGDGNNSLAVKRFGSIRTQTPLRLTWEAVLPTHTIHLHVQIQCVRRFLPMRGT